MPLQIEQTRQMVEGFSLAIGSDTIQVKFAKPTPLNTAIARIRMFLDAIEEPTPSEKAGAR